MSVIKSGYRITVTSWENDADNYSTHIRDGLDEHEARFHVDLLKLLEDSCNNSDKFGNMYDPEDSEMEAFDEACLEVFKKWDEAEEIKEKYDACNHALDIISEYTGYSDFYTRVVESIVVEYVPQEIVIEDVSSKFGV